MGLKMADYLAQMKEKHPAVGDVRSIGLFGVMECVKDRKTREAFPKELKLDKLAVRVMRENYMLGRAGNVIPIAPPLCITRDEIDEAVNRLDSVLKTMGEELEVS